MSYAETLNDQIITMAHSFIATLPSLVLGLAVLVITWIASRVASGIASRIADRSSLRIDLKNLLKTVIRLGVWIIGILIAGSVVIPGMTPASLFAGLGFGAVAIGFAFQDIFENFLAGVMIMLRDKMEIGDIVESNGILGTVEKITLRETYIRQFSGELTMLPNSMIFKNPVKVITDAPVRRNEVVVGVSYDTDLPLAEATIRKAVEAVESVKQDKGVDIYAQEFNSSSIDFLVRFWIDTSSQDYLGTKQDVMFAIKKALDDTGIEIPFPYITHTFKEAVPLEQPANEAA